MAVRLRSQLLSGLFALAIGTLLYISWSDILDSFSLSTHPREAAQIWNAPTLDPDTMIDPPGLTPVPVMDKMDYRKMPDWGFNDKYRMDRQPSKTTEKCESSLWNTINQNPEMREKFISNIQLYVHNGSITMSEWNRLSHFNNPFGFMTYSHKDVMPALDLVPKPMYPLLTPKPGRDCISCAVVATGGVLWKSGKGREIDSHDYVFRVNGAAINGYEDDVGTRTDVYVHTSFSLLSSLWRLKPYNYTGAPHDEGIKYVLIPEGMRDFVWMLGLYKDEIVPGGKRPRKFYSGQFNETRFYVLHMDFLRYTRNRFLKANILKAGNWWVYRPTNGAFMMFLALHLCDRVDAYGFITNDHVKYSNYYYERGADTKVLFFPNHDYDMEKDLWKRLHELNIIHLYQGKTEPTPSQNQT